MARPSAIMTKTIIKPAQAAPALGPYNHGARAGDLLKTSRP
jgi:hypothetical protein